MITDITKNELLLYAYNELNTDRVLELETALKSNAELRRSYREITEMLHLMDHYSLSPHPTSVQIIKEESSSALEVH
ncbi:MAG: hypothetical protein JXR19_02440 [Bacteroidia bacterium]